MKAINWLAVKGFASEQDRFAQPEVVDPPRVGAAQRPFNVGGIAAGNNVGDRTELRINLIGKFR